MFDAVEGQAWGGVPETGFILTVIGRVRGRRPQATISRLEAKLLEVIDISALGDLKALTDKYLFLMNLLEGT